MKDIEASHEWFDWDEKNLGPGAGSVIEISLDPEPKTLKVHLPSLSLKSAGKHTREAKAIIERLLAAYPDRSWEEIFAPVEQDATDG